MRTVKYTNRFKRDYRREKSGQHGRKLDTLLMEVVDMLAGDKPLPRRNFDHPLTGEWNAIIAIVTFGRTSCLSTASRVRWLIGNSREFRTDRRALKTSPFSCA